MPRLAQLAPGSAELAAVVLVVLVRLGAQASSSASAAAASAAAIKTDPPLQLFTILPAVMQPCQHPHAQAGAVRGGLRTAVCVPGPAARL